MVSADWDFEPQRSKGGLHPQSGIRLAAECLLQAGGHLGEDPGLLVHEVVEGLPSHA